MSSSLYHLVDHILPCVFSMLANNIKHSVCVLGFFVGLDLGGVFFQRRNSIALHLLSFLKVMNGMLSFLFLKSRIV